MIDEWSATDTLELRFEPTHHAASEARARLREHLARKSVDPGLLADVELTAAELLSNAVEQCPSEPATLDVTIDPVSIHLTITNHCPPEAGVELPEVDAGHEALAERGRGLAIVQAVADGMWIHRNGPSFSVSCLHRRHR